MPNFLEISINFFSGIFSTVQFLALLISGILTVGIVFIALSLRSIRKENLLLDEKFLLTEDLASEISSRAWQKIEKKLMTNDEAQLKLALIEADDILDETLKISGHKGQTVAERLGQVIPGEISNLEDLLRAHRLRNQIVHEPDLKIAPEDIKRALSAYKKFLIERGLIE